MCDRSNELLVVISIIGLLSTIAMVSLNNARKKSRDARRISDIRQIRKALEIYKEKMGYYPAQTSDACCGGWDVGPCGTDETFIQPLVGEGIMSKVPVDPSYTGTGCGGYRYYRYGASSYGCDGSNGAFYVLEIYDLETDSRPPTKFEGSGWSCPNRNWQNEVDYVTGGFTNFDYSL